MSELIELTESLLEHLEKGRASGIPTIDFAVEAVRLCLKQGYPYFLEQLGKTFFGRIDSKEKAIRLEKKFLKINRLRLAELVLSEREV